MTFDEAKSYVLTFGKHKGKTLHEIGADDDGLTYLDWVIDQEWLRIDTRHKIKTYLKEPVIARELDRILEDA